MRVFLTGFMGSGKTTVGRLLSRRLALPFIDLDDEIERRAGMTVKEIFREGGEPLFRRLEQDVLAASVAGDPESVIATGGGTLTVERNLRLLARSGVSVWLDPPFSVITERIGGLGRDDRPLFRDDSQALELYRRRLPVYRRADLRLAIEPGEAPEEVAARLALLLEGAS